MTMNNPAGGLLSQNYGVWAPALLRSIWGNGASPFMLNDALGILRSYGADAHIYLPGVGTVNGITAGNYLDSAGVTAASVDNPVGLSLDALQAMTLGSELNATLDFTGWVTQAGWSVSSGVASYSGAGGTNALKDFTLKANTHYLIEIDATVASGGYKLMCGFDTVSGTISTSGRYAARLIRGSNTYLYVAAVGASELSFPRISVREIPGIHATQATTANKPILRRGLLNQLLWSQDMSQSAWIKAGTSFLAGTLTATAGTSAKSIFASNVTAPTTATTVVFVVKAGTLGFVQILNSGDAQAYANFDLTTGVVGSSGTKTTPLIYSVGGGYYFCIAQMNATTTFSVSFRLYMVSSAAASYGADIVSASGTETVFLAEALVTPGTYTAQQIIDAGGIPLTTSAAASNPSAGKYSWQFDGSNDSLSLSAPLFQMSDDHAVIVGAKCARATGTVQVVISPSRDASNGNALGRLQFDASGTVSAAWTPTGGAGAVILTSPTSLVGSTKVLTAYKTGNTKKLRIDGVLIGSDSTAQTDIGMTSAAISDYRTGLQLPFEGSIYPVIAIKGTVTDADLLTLERFVGQLSGVSL